MQITDPWPRMDALTELMGMVDAHGDDDWAARLAAKADAVAAQVTGTDRRARSLSRLAMILLGTIGNTSSGRDDARSSSPALVRVRRLLAEALVTASWSSVVVGLARVDPAAVSTLAGELQVRWGFGAPGGARDGGAEDS